MQGKQIIKGAVVLGVVLTFTSGTHAHTNQDHLDPDAGSPMPRVEPPPPSPPHAEAPRPRRPAIRRPPIWFPFPGDPFTPTVARPVPSAPLIAAWVTADDGQEGVLAPEFGPLRPVRLDIGIGLDKHGASDLFTDGRKPNASSSSSGITVSSAVPAPGAIALLGLAALSVGRRRWRTV